MYSLGIMEIGIIALVLGWHVLLAAIVYAVIRGLNHRNSKR